MSTDVLLYYPPGWLFFFFWPVLLLDVVVKAFYSYCWFIWLRIRNLGLEFRARHYVHHSEGQWLEMVRLALWPLEQLSWVASHLHSLPYQLIRLLLLLLTLSSFWLQESNFLFSFVCNCVTKNDITNILQEFSIFTLNVMTLWLATYFQSKSMGRHELTLWHQAALRGPSSEKSLNIVKSGCLMFKFENCKFLM